jgi:hypothetical protein
MPWHWQIFDCQANVKLHALGVFMIKHERTWQHWFEPCRKTTGHNFLGSVKDEGHLSQEERNVDHGTDDAQKFKEEGEQEEEVRMYILDLDGNQS